MADAGSGSENTTDPEILASLELDLEWKVWGEKRIDLCLRSTNLDLFQCLHPIGRDLALCTPSSLINQIMKQERRKPARQEATTTTNG